MKLNKITLIAALTTLSACHIQKPIDDSVILINTFQVPPGKEEDALNSWRIARDFLKKQPGYISTQLHQNIDPNGSYQLVNIAKWRSADDFYSATKKMYEMLPENKVEGVQIHPGLFTIIESDTSQ